MSFIQSVKMSRIFLRLPAFREKMFQRNSNCRSCLSGTVNSQADDKLLTKCSPAGRYQAVTAQNNELKVEIQRRRFSKRQKMAHSEDELRRPNDPLPPGAVLRLYSMRMCPYAQRARLVLAAKKVPYDRVNVDLNNKPDWFFDINFYGEVPVIIHNGKNIFESLICAEYLEEAFPEPKLYSSDVYQRALERIYFNHWTKKGIPAFYSLLKAGHLDLELAERFDQHIGKMEEFLKTASTPYFNGTKPGFSDYMIWPWFERIPMLGKITDYEMSSEKFPLLTVWVSQMWKDPVVQECKIDPELFIQHYIQYRTGRPDFTIGASKPKGIPEALENLDGLRDPATRDRQSKK